MICILLLKIQGLQPCQFFLTPCIVLSECRKAGVAEVVETIKELGEKFTDINKNSV